MNRSSCKYRCFHSCLNMEWKCLRISRLWSSLIDNLMRSRKKTKKKRSRRQLRKANSRMTLRVRMRRMVRRSKMVWRWSRTRNRLLKSFQWYLRTTWNLRGCYSRMRSWFLRNRRIILIRYPHLYLWIYSVKAKSDVYLSESVFIHETTLLSTGYGTCSYRLGSLSRA